MKFILSCIVLLIVQQSATAINCYSCTAGTDGCGASTFNKAGAGVTASADSSLAYCTKTIQSGNSNAAGRGYGASGTCTSASVTVVGVTYTQLCCTTELCNSGHNQVANVFLAAMAAIIGYILTK